MHFKFLRTLGKARGAAPGPTSQIRMIGIKSTGRVERCQWEDSEVEAGSASVDELGSSAVQGVPQSMNLCHHDPIGSCSRVKQTPGLSDQGRASASVETGRPWVTDPPLGRSALSETPSQRSLHVTFPLSSFHPVPQAQSVDPARGPLAPTAAAHWHRDSTGIPDGLNTNVY